MTDLLTRPKKTAKPEGRTAPKEVRREQLIEATIKSIAKYGIGGTTLSTVTDFAGLSIGIVNFHFKSKQNLLEETLVFLAKEHKDHWFKAYSDAGLNAGEKLRAIVDAEFHPKIYTRKKLAVWHAFYGEVRRRQIYRSLLDGIDTERFEITAGLCSEIIADGGYMAPDADTIASTLEALYDGLALHVLMYPGEFGRDQARNKAYGYLAAVFPKHFDMPAQDCQG